MSLKDFHYGVFIENSILKDSLKGFSQRTALLGQIVKVTSILGSDNVAVKFLKEGENWESTQFVCQQHLIAPIYEKQWSFIAAISSPQERVKLARNRDRCEKLLNLTKDMIVGFAGDNDVHLATIKYIGAVKGIGKCFGLKLHERLEGNRCDGSCAGITYFTCLPGYGIFTTINKITNNSYTNSVKNQDVKSDLDSCLEKNILFLKARDSAELNHEEIVTVYGKNQLKTTSVSPKPYSGMRNSQSLQNIVDLDNTNPNNDFDNNSIILPDKTYLLEDQKKLKNKTDMDLIEVIGNSWNCVTNNGKTDSYAQTSLPRSENKIKNKNATFVSHIMETSNNTVVGKKNKPFNENDLKKTIYNRKDDKKINERAEAALNCKPSTSKGNEKNTSIKYLDPPKSLTNDLAVGSLVEVSNDVSDHPFTGVIRWMGYEPGASFILVGVELDEEQSGLPLTLTDGVHNGDRLFQCGEGRALFVPLNQCQKDSRFFDGVPSTPVHYGSEKSFDKIEVVPGAVAPLCMPIEEDVEAVCGKFRGIQGHHNSCYLDVTLFSMFTYTAVFDSLLFRPRGSNDISDYDEVQRVLREEIVNPLRKNLFVHASQVMKLRKLLDRLSSVSGLTSEEKDPEEFLNSLLAQILKAEPFLKLNSGQESFYYQLFVEKDADLTLPTVQQLFAQSFLTSNIKLKEVPSCLIVQMPRFGKNYKMYPRILPSQLLDVTDVIETSPRQCIVCGKLARWECRECFDNAADTGLESTSFCEGCIKTVHRHELRTHHKPVSLNVPHDFAIMQEHCRPPRLFMELFAVICIETSHYVAFVKCGVGHKAPWCFFDSMADRKGERNGYNIPEMVACPDISRWLSDEHICRQICEDFPQDRHLPEHARRLLCDAYICMYQSPDVLMYSGNIQVVQKLTHKPDDALLGHVLGSLKNVKKIHLIYSWRYEVPKYKTSNAHTLKITAHINENGSIQSYSLS